MNGLALDLRSAFRQLRRAPGMAILVVFTLGTAIGLATSLFTILNAIVFVPWPVRDASRVVRVVDMRPRGEDGLPLAEWRYLSAHSRSLLGLTASNGNYGAR